MENADIFWYNGENRNTEEALHIIETLHGRIHVLEEEGETEAKHEAEHTAERKMQRHVWLGRFPLRLCFGIDRSWRFHEFDARFFFEEA